MSSVGGYARHVALACAVVLWPAVSAADEDHGTVVFEYVDAAPSQCVSGAPFRAAFSDIDATLVPLEVLDQSYGECFMTERRGVEVVRVEMPCAPGDEPPALKRTEVAARLSGTIGACQRGPVVRVLDGNIAVSLQSGGGTWDVPVPASFEQYGGGGKTLNSFISRLLVRQSYVWDDGAVRFEFEQRPRKIDQKIVDLRIQNDAKLPTKDAYGIIIETKIAATFGAIETLTDGDTQ